MRGEHRGIPAFLTVSGVRVLERSDTVSDLREAMGTAQLRVSSGETAEETIAIEGQTGRLVEMAVTFCSE